MCSWRGALVNKELQEKAIEVGNPLKIIRKNIKCNRDNSNYFGK